MEFRRRDYRAEESAISLPRVPIQDHPLTATRTPAMAQVEAYEKFDFEDPLRADAVDVTVPTSSVQRFRNTSSRSLSDGVNQLLAKEWAVFSKSLLQKFSYSTMIITSSALDITERNNKEDKKSLAQVHTEEHDDLEIMVNEEKKVITEQEYVSRLQELKPEINQAWKDEDRIKALKLSIKVSRLLIDTTVLQFYPTLFMLVIDVLDMFGDLVWERIKKKAEYSENGTLICSLPESFFSVDVCAEAKETCYNWFCKIGSIHELLPRIYLELAILQCRRFLEDNYQSSLQRLTRMMRGIADPLAFVYCHLYMAHRAELLQCRDIGYLIGSISDINSFLRIIFDKEASQNHSNRNIKLLINLMEPAIEWNMKCIFMKGKQNPNDILVEFGFGSSTIDSTWNVPWTSIVIHHLFRQLPSEIISSYVLEILELFERIKDISLNQHLNYRLIGVKLCESPPHHAYLEPVLNRVMKILSQYDHLGEYLVVADAYLDIILHCSMGSFLFSIFDGILKRAENRRLDETELDTLQSILVKILDHFSRIENAFALEHFMAIHRLLNGTSQNVINMHILEKATRSASISDQTTMQMLFEMSKALHDGIDILNEDYKQKSYLICRFVQMVDFGDDIERHLTFLAECRAAFSYIDVIMDTLVHLSNNLGIKAIKGRSKFLNFVRACLAFSEVTIPSIPKQLRCMSLFIATAEVALLSGLFSHAEGLLNSAVDCLLCLEASGAYKSIYEDEILSVTCKLCSILVFIPGTNDGGIAQMQRHLMSVVDNQSWKSSRMTVKILSGIIYQCGCLSQNLLPLLANNIKFVGNNEQLFFGDQSYEQELSLVTGDALESLLKAIEQEHVLESKGKLALEACNCLVVTFKANYELRSKCFKLIEIARSCLHPKDKYLKASVDFFNKRLENVC